MRRAQKVLMTQKWDYLVFGKNCVPLNMKMPVALPSAVNRYLEKSDSKEWVQNIPKISWSMRFSYLFIYLFIYLCIYLFICLFIYLFILNVARHGYAFFIWSIHMGVARYMHLWIKQDWSSEKFANIWFCICLLNFT